MHKILSVARAEYLVAIRSKAFLIGVFLMPILMLGGIVVQYLLKDQVDKTDRKVAIIDHSGFLYSEIESANQWRTENEIYKTDENGTRVQTQPRFIFERAPDASQDAVTLSRRVESGDLFAYLIIDSEVLDPGGPEAAGRRSLAYHTKTPTFQALPDWLRYVINREVLERRFQDAQLDHELTQRLSQQVGLTSLGLVDVSASGEAGAAKEINQIETYVVPIAAMVLIYMIVMTTAPTLLNQVLEEKMQKISEVLISSITPFQLLMGKLCGVVGVAYTLAALYLGCAYAASHYFGVADAVPLSLYGWSLLMMLLALFMYGSIFSAIGAACNEIKDAQSLMTPAMLLVMIPFFCIGVIIQSPSSPFAVGMSLFPPATPTLMMLRIGLPPGPPLWQILLSIGLTGVFTILCVAAAGKIFRIGILAQGQAPSIPKLAKWLVAK